MGSIIAIRYTQGYLRPGGERPFQGTGILAANSFPTGAEVHLNGKLVGVTDENFYLEPGDYQVIVRKDGFVPWQKQLHIEQELVTQTNAQLFRQVPGFTPLTVTGVRHVVPSPDGEKLLFYTASASAQTKNGLYILELGGGLLANQREPRQIAEDTPGFDLSKAAFTWSPDNSQVILASGEREVLLDLTRKNALSTLPDIGLRKKQLLSEWEAQLYLKERQYFSRFPNEVLEVATQSATNVYLSPDKKKLLYTATASATLPEGLVPPLPARNTQPEERQLQPGTTYVYDREEDKNFPLTLVVATTSASRVFLADDLANREPRQLVASPSGFTRLQASTSAQTAQRFAQIYSPLYSSGVQWFPDSKHLLFAEKGIIYLMEYDNTNKTPVYAGPFAEQFLYPWPDGSRLLILTTFSEETPENLYAIELK